MRMSTRRRRQRSLRKQMLSIVVTVAAVGAAFALWPERALNPPSQEAAEPPPRGALTRAPRNSFDHLFQRGLRLMQQGRAHAALVTLEQARLMRPHVPELLVNMGFVRLALEDHVEARALFTRALELRPDQYNAYYGLAGALAGDGDLDGAIGAMRTYAHLAPEDDPFRRRALSAVWEWDFERRHGDDALEKLDRRPDLKSLDTGDTP